MSDELSEHREAFLAAMATQNRAFTLAYQCLVLCLSKNDALDRRALAEMLGNLVAREKEDKALRGMLRDIQAAISD